MQMKEINKLTDEFNWKTGLYHGVDYRTSLKIPKGSYRIKDGEPTKIDYKMYVEHTDGRCPS